MTARQMQRGEIKVIVYWVPVLRTVTDVLASLVSLDLELFAALTCFC